MEAAQREAEKKGHEKLVTVTLVTVEQESGVEQIQEMEVTKGKTEVSDLKQELGVPAELSLWVIEHNGRRRRLADHETFDVKKGDRFVVIHPGGVS